MPVEAYSESLLGRGPLAIYSMCRGVEGRGMIMLRVLNIIAPKAVHFLRGFAYNRD